MPAIRPATPPVQSARPRFGVRPVISGQLPARAIPLRAGDDDLAGLAGRALLAVVQRVAAAGHQPKSYAAAGEAIFSTIDNVIVEGARGVYSAYSDVFVPGAWSSGSQYREDGDQDGDGYTGYTMNLEHLWPQSYFKKRLPMKSDVHHLLPTFMRANEERGRLPFGIVADGEVLYHTSAGAKKSQDTFEPPDSVKGQVARSMFYFLARYHDRPILPVASRDEFWNLGIAVLLGWHTTFPVDAWELERNSRVEQFQGNRNPFVDDPGLADRIGETSFRIA